MSNGDIMFKNTNYSQSLSESGVVQIPFLNEEELFKVREFYNHVHKEEHPPTMYSNIHMTIWDSELDYKLKVYQGLKDILQPACNRTFQKYRAISQQFIVKLPGSETDFPVHQDWSIVDETKHVSLNLWLALQDVDEGNGAMWMVRGSHNIDRKVRGPGYLFPDYTGIIEHLQPMMKQFPMKAGEALVFYHRTIHGSPFNNSNDARIAVQTSIIPDDVPLQIYFQRSENDRLEVHRPKDDFVFNYKRVREESGIIPPSDNPVEIREPMIVPPVNIEEVKKVTAG